MDTLRGVFPQPKTPPKRNFIKENVKLLKDYQKSNSDNDTDSTTKSIRTLRPSISQRYLDNKIASATSRTKFNQAKVIDKTASQKIIPKSASVSSLHSCCRSESSCSTRDISSQTGDVNDEMFLKDVIIRLPSASVLKEIKNKSAANPSDILLNQNQGAGDKTSISNDGNLLFNECNETESIDTELNDQPLSARSLSLASMNTATSFKTLGLDKNSAHTHMSDINENRSNVPASYRVGELPKYLKDMKEKNAEKIKQEAMIDPNCPPGHVSLTDSERIEALAIAKRRFNNLIEELNKMPMTTQTLKLKQRKMEIEKELNKLENSIRVFSRLKVYVKIND